MARVVRAEGPILQRIVATTPLVACGGLSRDAFVKYEAAQAKAAWALGHRHRFALVQDNDVLASAECYDLAGQLDGQPVTICGVATVLHCGRDDGVDCDRALVEQLVEDAAINGADLALLFRTASPSFHVSDGFKVVPTMRSCRR